ncbi:MAG: hypothetical protein Q9164_000066 [Protoblastenia rupestris]
MPKLSTPKHRASNVSSATNPAVSSSPSKRSSILRSSFPPSSFQLSLFASVIQGLDSQHLRIHDTNSSRLRCEHAIGSRASITCLEWGFFEGDSLDRQDQKRNKKRKRVEQSNGNAGSCNGRNVALAFGTSDSEIHLYSPAEAKIVGLLKEGHTQGIRDFKFSDEEGRNYRSTIPLLNGSANTIRPLGSSVICASHLAYILDPDSQTSTSTFNASTNSVHTIVGLPSRSSEGAVFLTAAEADHFLNVFHEGSPTLIGSLRTESEVVQVDFHSRHRMLDKSEVGNDLAERLRRPQEALVIINKDGVLELFPEPLDFGSLESRKTAETTREKMKRRTRRSEAKVRIVRPDKASSLVPLIGASFRDSYIILAWVEGGINVLFDTLQWRDESTGAILIEDNTNIVKGKSSGIAAIAMNGVKEMGNAHVDESRTVVVNGLGTDSVGMEDQQPEVIDISSGEEDSDSEDDVRLADSANATTAQDLSQAQDTGDVDMKDADLSKAEGDGQQDPREQDQEEEPSFGELLRANASETVDVQASFVSPNAQSLVPAADKNLQQLPSGMSLGTVLTQSLRTNDKNLLETCFHVKDLRTVRATIERLESSFAANLLQRLAERLHSRPGRAGSLMVWIQWTLIAHGGYLAGQPEVMKKLASLHQVVKDRANSLQSLLSLKGKLDMLEAQMNLRKSMQGKSRVNNDEDEDDVIYVEGQEMSDSERDEEQHSESDGDADDKPSHAGAESKDVPNVMNDGADIIDEEADSGIEMPTVNGNVADSEDEGSDSEDEGMFDEEASSTNQDSGEELSEDEIDHDDVDTESSDADTSPPPKRPAKSAVSDRKRS